jgi:ComF family protein
MMFKQTLKKIIQHPVIGAVRDTCFNIVSPPHCTACMTLLTTRAIFCDVCDQRIKSVVSTTIELTKNHTMRVFAVADYQEPLKQLIIAKAWSDIIASTQLGELIWERTTIRHVNFDYIVPIPLHWTRYAWRGFNQVEEIGKVLSRRSGKPAINLLRRQRLTSFQSRLIPAKRAENVKDVFVITAKKPEIYAGKHVVLVDDLMTTGSTLKEAGKELLRLKPATITAVVACRVI